jgi:hypothetical protein
LKGSAAHRKEVLLVLFYLIFTFIMFLMNSICWYISKLLGRKSFHDISIELNWIELNWIELNWIELNWIELNWIELNWIELNWIELSWVELNWVELSWVELRCSAAKLFQNSLELNMPRKKNTDKLIKKTFQFNSIKLN